MERNIRLVIEYDGTNYAGWQKQKNANTVQQVMEESLCKITRENNKVIGSSRTDTGVHAKGFSANFLTNSKIPASKIKYAINAKLPEDIVVINSEEVPINFHSRYDAKGKRYIYTIINQEHPSAIYRNYTYHYRQKLNVNNMRLACKYFIGTNDFESFRNKGSLVISTVRTLTDLNIQTQGNLIKIVVSGNGFLYNMVRIIVGTLVDIGIGKIKPEDVEYILNAKDRTKAGKTVPARGLCLDEVFY